MIASSSPHLPPSLARYLASFHANARVRPGLVSNPLARTNWRAAQHPRLRALLPEPDNAVETPSIADLDATFERLFFDRGVNVVILNGGDGTIHHALNSAIGVIERASRDVFGEGDTLLPMPLFLFVNGGGMNMLARVFGTRGDPVRTARRFFALARGSTFGALPKRGVPLLAAEDGQGRRRYGYIFGSEIVFNALTMYERFGQGYPALTRFLWEVGAGWTFRTELWFRYGHLLDAPRSALVIDGCPFPSYTAAVATTVPLQLVKGLVAVVRRVATPGTMNTVAILETDKGAIIQRIPQLMVGAPADGVLYGSGTRHLSLRGPYTLDGERFDRHDEPPDAPLEVRGTTRVVWGIDLA